MNPTRLPKEILLPDRARRNMQVTKGYRVKSGTTLGLEISFLKSSGSYDVSIKTVFCSRSFDHDGNKQNKRKPLFGNKMELKAIVRGVPNWTHTTGKRLAECSNRHCTVLFCLHSSDRISLCLMLPRKNKNDQDSSMYI